MAFCIGRGLGCTCWKRTSRVGFVGGPFCGKFRDELGGDTDSEEDEEPRKARR